MLRTLVQTQELAKHLDNPNWIIIDCRFDLAQPDWGFKEYLEFHIPGAQYAHLDQDLSGAISPETGRHPLPDTQTFAQKLAAWGIDNSKQVVAYDNVGGSFAVRLWWLLQYFGIQNVAILNGGLGKWIQENRPTKSGMEKGIALPSIPLLAAHHDLLVTTDEMMQKYSDPAYRIIDARTQERYLGEHEPIDPVPGRIPGAINRFHGENLQPDGTLKPVTILKQEFTSLLGNISPQNIIVYCGSGVTSCHHLLALQIVGLSGARLYLGSWSEWIRDPKRPIARGM
ncbi:MAG: sulfurtransferase [Anaerolineaceae bacterium]|nr:sulfurtransferase [Anaerolineaceae bacterium]